jgi:hypothetical protein
MLLFLDGQARPFENIGQFIPQSCSECAALRGAAFDFSCVKLNAVSIIAFVVFIVLIDCDANI